MYIIPIAVTNLTFAQPARRNLLAPVLIAFLILGITIALVLRYTPHRTADLTITRLTVYPAHTVFKSDSILVNRDTAQDDLYILADLRIDDRLNLPLFIKDFTATLITADGEELTTSATQKNDLPTLYSAFPQLKTLSFNPLLRETLINPGQSAEGMVLLHFPVTEAIWNARKSATLIVDLYHQGAIPIRIPNAGKSSVNSPSSDTAGANEP
jgi:hypothetical protein